MSQVRENSKCGLGDVETHVQVPATTTVAAITTTQGSSAGSSSSSSPAVASGSRRSKEGGQVNNSRGEENNMEVSIRIPLALGDDSTGDQDGLDDDEDEEYEDHQGLYVGRKEDHEDSDPPVENFFTLAYNKLRDLDEDDEEEGEDEDGQQDSNNNTSPGHDWLAVAAQEHRRMLQRRRAQGHHHRKRKRSNTNVDTNYVPPYKKRFRRQMSVLPSKFLLGGNIRDPLNLASLADAKVNAALNAETPKSSPVPIPMYRHGEVPVFIPKNPDDPLGLQTEAENPYDFIAGIRRNKIRKHRHRKKGGRKRTDSECSIDKSEDSDGGERKDISGSSEEDLKIGVKQQQQGVEIIEKPKKEEKAEGEEEKKKPDTQPSGKNVTEEKETSKTNVENAPSTAAAPIPPPPLPPKKRSRTRKRSRKGRIEELKSDLLFGKSSEYVPLGTPSVHESSQFYEDDHDQGSQPGNYEAFESPLVTYCNSLIAEGCMEPFSPPPKPEVKRRRVEVPAEASSADTGTPAEGKTAAAGPSIQVEAEQVNQKQTPVVQVKQKHTPAPESSKPVTKSDGNFVKPQLPPIRFHNRKRFRHKADPIVSPVIPQPGSHRRFNHHHHHHHHHGRHHNNQNIKKSGESVDDPKKMDSNVAGDQSSGSEDSSLPKFRKKDETFQFGNYNRYYGYRTTDGDDLRLRAFPRDFFHAKDVLDVGCNIGHVTLLIARDHGANFVQGIDIDPKLIEVAKKNVKHYVDRDPSDETIRFPHSCPLMYGVLQPPPSTVGDKRRIPFPYNVSFKHVSTILKILCVLVR